MDGCDSYSMFASKNRMVKFISDDFVYTPVSENSDTCWRTNYYSQVSKQNYTEGLGMTMNYFYDVNMGQYEQDLLYYKKGTDTWGTPVSTDCTSLIGIAPIEPKKTVTVNISPDPVETQVKIFLNNVGETSGYRFTLTDLLGRTLVQNTLESNPFTITRQGPSGLYFISVYDDKGILLARTKLIYK